MKSFKIISSVVALVISSLFLGCGRSHSTGPQPEDNRPGFVRTEIDIMRVGVLRKSSATSTISLSKLILTAVSTTTPPDTVRDTSVVSGNAALSVTRVLTLKPLRNWSITAKTLDSKDSVIHTGTTSSFFVKPADTALVSLTLASRFTMYEANFLALPDSISSSVSGTGKNVISFTRALVKVDGTTRADSSAAFASAQSVKLTYDYVTVGSHTVLLEVYGTVNTYSGILYSGSVVANVVAGTDGTQTFNLAWVGPTTGSGSLTVTIGKVGKVTFNSSLPGTVIP